LGAQWVYALRDGASKEDAYEHFIRERQPARR
jgi:hypothetical protein